MTKAEATQLLRTHGFRATTARVRVLQCLARQPHAVGAEEMHGVFPNTDKVTVYRILDAFARVGIIHVEDVGHGHKDYELADRTHHHHIICEQCGRVEDVTWCDEQALAHDIKKSSKHFAHVRTHRLSFYGVCRTCTKKQTRS